MEKNKKIFYILLIIIIILLIVYCYKQIDEISRREGFLPLSMAYTNFSIFFFQMFSMIPFVLMKFIIIVAGASVYIILTNSGKLLYKAATVEF